MKAKELAGKVMGEQLNAAAFWQLVTEDTAQLIAKRTQFSSEEGSIYVIQGVLREQLQKVSAALRIIGPTFNEAEGWTVQHFYGRVVESGMQNVHEKLVRHKLAQLVKEQVCITPNWKPS